jgi:hypothetical protein
MRIIESKITKVQVGDNDIAPYVTTLTTEVADGYQFAPGYVCNMFRQLCLLVIPLMDTLNNLKGPCSF